jgi:hypothetical protein
MKRHQFLYVALALFFFGLLAVWFSASMGRGLLETSQMIGEAGRWGIFGNNYQWVSTNEIMLQHGCGPPHPILIVRVPTGERTVMPLAEVAVNNVFTNDQCSLSLCRGWLVASGKTPTAPVGATLVTHVASTNVRIYHGVKLDTEQFWSHDNICWFGLGYSPPYSGWLCMQVSSGVLKKLAASFSPQYPLGFSRDDAFLSLNDFISERTNTTTDSVRMSRWTTNGAAYRESQMNVSLPRSELSGAYLSPRGDKILWCFLEAYDHRSISSHFHAAVVYSCECWISTERAADFKRLGNMHYQGEFLPKWLPDDRRFSFISDGLLYIASTE